ncbi:hypothetical protein J1605_012234 [Eschrichtius robustus]|uniref:Laminin subunit alpha-4 n=1 Tax=Eschrichtius robustus TaxID=9764 RepID=A0AB34GHH5_ESCRO|nr:hypothetical protein J1605_012234 [Eschrichtius robustus]
MLEEIRRRQPFLTQRELVDEEADEAYELLSQAESWQRQYNDTHSLFPVVLEQLDDYNAKLSDLQESLDLALDHIRDAEDVNRATAARQRDHKKQHDRVREQIAGVNASLRMSSDSLTMPRLTLSELDDIIKNASGIYAEIDGAKNELQRKLSNLSNLSHDLVQEAVDHAQNLQQEADELSRNLHSSDVNGLVQKALDASNVYENIANYVTEANETAEQALNITDRIYDAVSGIDTQIIYHKDESENLLNQARELQARANSSNDEAVADTSRRVGGALARKSALKNRLNDAIKRLQATERGDAQQRLGQSKLITAEANKTTMEVQQAAAPMANNLTNWSQNLQRFDSSAYNTAVDSARDAVGNLTEVVPQLLDQLRTVEQKRPASNVSASIQRIRELIAQTRSVASKIQVSMMFDGQLAVEVHPKARMDDLKTFTSLSLYMKPPPVKQAELGGTADQFVLYLGSKNLPASLNLPGFVGCLELATLNNDVISLYNFKHIYNMDPSKSVPCARDKLAFTQSRAASYFFDGSSYAVVRDITRRGKFGQVTRFDIEVRTPADNGLVLLMVNGSDVFSISLDNGTVIMDVKGIKVQSADKQYNDGLSHFIITSVSPARYS